MAKITPFSPIKGISGKLYKNDDFYLATKRRTGTVYMVNRDRKLSATWSEKQIAYRKAFAARSKAASGMAQSQCSAA